MPISRDKWSALERYPSHLIPQAIVDYKELFELVKDKKYEDVLNSVRRHEKYLKDMFEDILGMESALDVNFGVIGATIFNVEGLAKLDEEFIIFKENGDLFFLHATLNRLENL